MATNMKHDRLIGAMLPWMALITAILLAAGAAAVSVFGLTLVFVGAVIPVAIMASFIEVGKLVGASWLYRHWSLCDWKLKIPITSAVIVAMLVTSLGVFGFLSRAYTEHAADNQHLGIEVTRITSQIDNQMQRRNQAQKTLDQINESLNTLIEYDKISGEEGYRAVRERNLPTIREMEQIIEESSEKISELTQQKLDLEKTVAVSEAEIGPIRFVAELVWGEENAKDNYDRAVRILILLLVFIFDPFAVCLLIAANHSLMLREKQENNNNNNNNNGGDVGGGTNGGPKNDSGGRESEDSTTSSPIEKAWDDTEGAIYDEFHEDIDDLNKSSEDDASSSGINRTQNQSEKLNEDYLINPTQIISHGNIDMINTKTKYTHHNALK